MYMYSMMCLGVASVHSHGISSALRIFTERSWRRLDVLVHSALMSETVWVWLVHVCLDALMSDSSDRLQ